jgi:hypothetical protein
VWGSLERGAPRSSAARKALVAVTATELVRELEELIQALDRRLPRVEQAGEAAIAADAARLRDKAVARLAELAAEGTPARVAQVE